MPDYLLNRLEQHLLTHRERSLLRLCRQELQSIEAQAERLRISIDPDKRLGDSLSIQSGVLLGRISSLTKKLVSLSSARQDIRDANRRQPCSPSLKKTGDVHSVLSRSMLVRARAPELVAQAPSIPMTRYIAPRSFATGDVLYLGPELRIDAAEDNLVAVTPFASTRRGTVSA